MKRLLLIKMSSLGDVVHALPAVSDAAAAGYRIDWVVEEAFADIPARHPAVDRVIPIAWRRWRKALGKSRDEMRAFRDVLGVGEYDLVLDAQGLIKSAMVSLFTPLRRARVAGLNFTSAREPWSAFAYGQRNPVPWGQHAIDRNRQLFAAALGYPVPETLVTGVEVEGPVPGDETDEPTLMLLHGTTWQTKHWPEPMWRALADLARQAGFRVCAPWGNEAERVRAESLTDVGVEVLPPMSLGALMDELARTRLAVSVDSGLGHLSAALGVPTVGLFGPTSGILTGCRGTRAVTLQSNLSCSPCLGKRCKKYRGEPLSYHEMPVEPACFAALTPDRVWQQGLDLLRAQTGS